MGQALRLTHFLLPKGHHYLEEIPSTKRLMIRSTKVSSL
jgi:hypothetical protein